MSSTHGFHIQRFPKFLDFSLTNVKFPWPTESRFSQISLHNGLNRPLLSTHLFMLFQVTCNVHDLIVPEYNMQKRINFFENPKSIFKYPKLYLSILTDSSFVILETLQQKSNSSIKGKKNGQLLIILLYRRDRKIKAVPFFQVVIRFHRVLEKFVSKDVH